MKIACYCSNDHFSSYACASACKVRFQNIYTFLHSSCCYQHLRNEYLIIFKSFTYNTHSLDHVIKNIWCCIPLIKCFLNCCADQFSFSSYYQIKNFIHFTHNTLPPEIDFALIKFFLRDCYLFSYIGASHICYLRLFCQAPQPGRFLKYIHYFFTGPIRPSLYAPMYSIQ